MVVILFFAYTGSEETPAKVNNKQNKILVEKKDRFV